MHLQAASALIAIQIPCLKLALNLALVHDGFEQATWEAEPQGDEDKTAEAVRPQAHVFISDAHQLNDHSNIDTAAATVPLPTSDAIKAKR